MRRLLNAQRRLKGLEAVNPVQWMRNGAAHDGILIVVDGMQRSGKTTVVGRIQRWLVRSGECCSVTEWNSTDEIAPLVNHRKRRETFTPRIWNALHYADFVIRYEEVILPALLRGEIVLCDRYFFTPLIRDVLKGIPVDDIVSEYGWVPYPDLSLFFVTSPRVAYQRHQEIGSALHRYSSGKDVLGEEMPELECYCAYQALIAEGYGLFGRWTGTVTVNTDAMDVERVTSVACDAVRRTIAARRGAADNAG